MQDKIVLKQLRDFGEIIEVYFQFLKQNLKLLFDTFLRYNAVWLILLFIGSYFVVTGFTNLIVSSKNGMGGDADSYSVILIVTVISYMFVGMLLMVYNYGLGSSFLIEYEENQGLVEPKKVFKRMLNRLPAMLGGILIAFGLYILMIIVSVILAIIPFIGSLVQYVLSLGFSALMGLAFICIFAMRTGPLEAFSEAWSMLVSNFWKCVGVNLVVGMLLAVVLMMMVLVPSILTGIYVFHAVENSVAIEESLFARSIFVLVVFFYLALLAFWQVLSQLVNGVLYFNLHEKKYLSFTRSRIEQIGVRD